MLGLCHPAHLIAIVHGLPAPFRGEIAIEKKDAVNVRDDLDQESYAYDDDENSSENCSVS
jgi:hypothetical protein